MLVVMVRLLGVATALSLCACYHPSFRDCAVSCESGNGCPDGLTCDMGSKLCTTQGTSCPIGGGDAMADVDTSCWPLAPSNFGPCATSFPPSIGSLSIDVADIMQDSSSHACDYTFNGVSYCLLHVTSMTVTTGRTYTVMGTRPVIIASDGDIIIDGTVKASFVGGPVAGCTATAGGISTAYGAGGGGGGNGTQGAAGGDGDGPAGSGGAALGDATLVPLVMGCPGASGGTGGGVAGGGAGSGGGAIELSSKTRVKIGGVVLACGAGGRGGIDGSVRASGGGGGGAGGSLLLEAPMVEVATGSQVCAVGGGGGAGGISNGSGAGPDGNDGVGCGVATGGNLGANPPVGNGGNGGIDLDSASQPTAGLAMSSPYAAGGGGGAAGRIRIHAITRLTGGTIKPTPPAM